MTDDVPKLTRVQRRVMQRMHDDGLELMAESDGSAWLWDVSGSGFDWKAVVPVSNITAERLILRGLVVARLTKLGRQALGVDAPPPAEGGAP